MEKDMKMQDKEFDDLFRSKLDDFEMEPSEQVWQNIGTELDGKKKVRSILPWLSIAASVIILVAAGILFIPKKAKEDPKDKHKNNLVHTIVKPSVVEPENNAPVSVQPAKEQQVAVVQVPATQVTRVHHTKKAEIPATQNIQDNQAIAKATPAKIDEQPVLAAVSQKASDITEPDAITEPPVTVKHVEITEPPLTQSQPVLASAQTPEAKTTKPTVKKRGIRNFGDLVNLVVARVDKRKDKVIEFTDTDDDESMITGVHIGSVRIKKDN
jgi:hypothetical protein